MTEQERAKYVEYAESLDVPVEASFLTQQQLETIKQERAKFESSQQFVASILKQDDFEEIISKTTIQGRIYSPSQMALLSAKLNALDGGEGNRADITESLVTKSGQMIIMSLRLQNILGFIGDGYMLKDELDELVNALKADNVPGPDIDRVTSSMNKFGAIFLQRGVFISLKGMLEESIGRTLNIIDASRSYNSSSAPNAAQPASANARSEELPAGFIEFLKNNDKEFDRIEHEITVDPMFVEFFSNLQKHYVYYQKLPADHMADEIIIRPQLWNKLSPQNKAKVQEIVERNRSGFQSKIQQIAASSGLSKLDELKKNLGK